MLILSALGNDIHHRWACHVVQEPSWSPKRVKTTFSAILMTFFDFGRFVKESEQYTKEKMCVLEPAQISTFVDGWLSSYFGCGCGCDSLAVAVAVIGWLWPWLWLWL